MARKVYISTWINQAEELGGHIVTKTIFDRMHWAERAVFEYQGLEIHLSWPKIMSYEQAKEVGEKIFAAWDNAGRPTKKEMSDKIREQNTWDIVGHGGVTVGQTWRKPAYSDGGGGGSS